MAKPWGVRWGECTYMRDGVRGSSRILLRQRWVRTPGVEPRTGRTLKYTTEMVVEPAHAPGGSGPRTLRRGAHAPRIARRSPFRRGGGPYRTALPDLRAGAVLLSTSVPRPYSPCRDARHSPCPFQVEVVAYLGNGAPRATVPCCLQGYRTRSGCFSWPIHMGMHACAP